MPASISSLVITFNCAREFVNPAVFSDHVISQYPEATPELLFFALEEVAPIAHSFLAGSFLAPYLERISHTVALTARKWGDHTYKTILARNVGMTATMVFARDDFADSIAQIEAGGTGVGYQEMGNKGAVGVRLTIRTPEDEATSLTFVAAHLAPAEDALERRNEDWKQIVQNLALSSVSQPKSKNKASARSNRNSEDQEPLLARGDHESRRPSMTGIYSSSSLDPSADTLSQTSGSYLMVAGDLNYRTADHPPRPYSRASFPYLSAEEGTPQHYKNLLPCDQLSRELAGNRTLHGLTEAAITFPPTYKYSSAAQKEVAALETRDSKPGVRRDEGADTTAAPMDWPWAGHRWPSWCDRILWLPTPGMDEIVPLKYTSLNLMSTSDHQPVALHLRLPLKPGALASDTEGLRVNPPFELDPDCTAKRVVARRKELAVGAAAFMVTTTEGQAIIAALLVGAIGGWAIMSNLLI